ncbi:dihydroorotate dehydrogenase-like protein [Novipirellula artificiosorum]|uniref:NAD-dependent dihydropyrimidine dehydrogenase subunit PreA n=1 Tax=Novipirellula artificiosorum TaxID=2528016 RepID=A0A5C6E3E2_9BACT|nr:dihydroorotate dehydrogenase-like protein [Novipirellula artificiosorum]TWU42487.1 NAD-dependent dihydropyrimidine dehydrogenase subunit PreA [Novipirellula artificiosorum]
MAIDLSTQYLGMKLDSPLIASASPLTGDIDSLQKLEQAGASAAVLPSLFEEQIEHDRQEVQRLHEFQSDSMAESLSFFPEVEYNLGPDQYLKLISDAVSTVKMPIIASLNGSTRGGWVHYAQLMERAGARAIELNIYFIPTEPNAIADDVENQYCELIAAVSETVHIPVGVKIGPYFSSLPDLVRRFVQAGADGLVLFNRYLAPDIDLETLTFKPDLVLSTADELRVALRWIAILRDQVDASLAATGGVHEVPDLVKALLVGSDAVMLASALLKQGPNHLDTLRTGLIQWMTEHEYTSVEQMKGSMSKENCSNPEGLSRANYMKALTSYTTSK